MPSSQVAKSLCRLQNQILQDKRTGLGELEASSNPERLDSARGRPEVSNSLGGTFSQLMQGNNPQDFGQGLPHSQPGVSHSQEEVWCTSGPPDTSLPTIRNNTTAAAQQIPAQIDLQVWTSPCKVPFQRIPDPEIFLDYADQLAPSGL